MEIIRDSSTSIFDKQIVDTFVRKVAIYPIGSTVTLSTGEQAIVIKNNLGEEGFNYRPVVRTDDNIEYDLLDEKNRYITIVPDNTNQLQSKKLV